MGGTGRTCQWINETKLTTSLNTSSLLKTVDWFFSGKITTTTTKNQITVNQLFYHFFTVKFLYEQLVMW